MNAKLLSKLGSVSILPAQKFPQIKLKPKEHKIITTHRQCLLPFDSFDPKSLDFALTDFPSGRVVEVRRSDNALIALGFFEPDLKRVDVFDLTPKQVTALPTVCDDFFVARVHDSWEKRRRLLHKTLHNTYRVCNGYVDGTPGLFVDLFSESFARIVATTSGAERLLPSVVEFFRCKGAEELLISSPRLGTERIAMIKPTLALSRIYIEGGIRHQWIPETINLKAPDSRYLIHSAYRRARRILQELSRNKKVLCINDRSGSATLNALTSARWVTNVEEEEVFLKWTQENMIFNHSENVFKKRCELVHSSLLDFKKDETFDVVYIENHAKSLNTLDQWKAALWHLLHQKLIAVGTIVIMSQETATLGIRDLNPGNKSNAAGRREIAQGLRDVTEEFNLRVRFLRAFSPSYDFPLLPEGESVAFSLIYLIEGPLI